MNHVRWLACCLQLHSETERIRYKALLCILFVNRNTGQRAFSSIESGPTSGIVIKVCDLLSQQVFGKVLAGTLEGEKRETNAGCYQYGHVNLRQPRGHGLWGSCGILYLPRGLCCSARSRALGWNGSRWHAVSDQAAGRTPHLSAVSSKIRSFPDTLMTGTWIPQRILN